MSCNLSLGNITFHVNNYYSVLVCGVDEMEAGNEEDSAVKMSWIFWRVSWVIGSERFLLMDTI